MSTKRLEASLAALTPAVVGYNEELPYISPEKVAKEALDFFRQGGPQLVFVIRFGVFLLNLISLVTQFKLLKNLDREKQMRFLEKRSRSRLMMIRGIALLMRLPLATYYYTQDEVCLALGYNRAELCDDAEKHQVTR